ncbi:MAG TPA: hypothetical protein VJS91_05895 [Nitrososphaeraceae archaeon]|nr:hypothetical protein [Nitrososphaeraceae archaeon]
MSNNGSKSELGEYKEDFQNANTNWPQVIDNIVNNVTGKNMEVTYDFDNLQINFPQVTGPDGILVGGAKCEINGRFLISTKLENSEE